MRGDWSNALRNTLILLFYCHSNQVYRIFCIYPCGNTGYLKQCSMWAAISYTIICEKLPENLQKYRGCGVCMSWVNFVRLYVKERDAKSNTLQLVLDEHWWKYSWGARNWETKCQYYLTSLTSFFISFIFLSELSVFWDLFLTLTQIKNLSSQK